MSKNVQINKDGITLETFIRDNEVLLSSMAVIATIIFFTKDLLPHFVATTISFLLIGGLILLCLEIWFKFPELVTWRLFLFRYVLLWFIVGIIFSWLYQYRTFWNIFLFIPATITSFVAITSSIGEFISAFKITRDFFGINSSEKTKLQKWMRSFAILIAIFIALYMGTGFAFGTNIFLDILKLNFPKI